MNDTLSYEDFLELWALKIEPDIQKFLLSMLTDDKFAIAVLDEIFEWVLCHCHLFPDNDSISPDNDSISPVARFAQALGIKMIIELENFPDTEASSLWQAALLNTLDQMMLPLDQTMLRLMPDQEKLPLEPDQSDDDLKKYLLKTVQDAKNEIDDEIYDDLFAAIEKRIDDNYVMAASLLRDVLSKALRIGILEEDI